MDILGNLIKETTRVSYHRYLRKSKKQEIQLRTLGKLLHKARDTAFGTKHQFPSILHDSNPLRKFKEHVPITNYETFHENWLKHTLNGKKDIIWPGKITHFALSSGTSSDTSKKIPVSDTMIRKFQKITIQQLSGLYELQLPSSFYESNVLIVGGSTDLHREGKLFFGDLSGILAKNKSFILSPFTKPSRKISHLKQWDKKMEAIIEAAPKWNIGVIAGVPSWVSQLLERIIERYALSSIHDIWPNLRIYSHGGIFVEPYEEKLKTLFGKPMIYQNTYLASEGYFAYQKKFDEKGMQLLLSNGVFFEFVEEKYFARLQAGEMENIPTLTIDQVRENTPYAMVITTCSGLWRYSLGDTIEFVDTNAKSIRITGRISFFLSAQGEHVSDANINETIRRVSDMLALPIEEFCVHVGQGNDQHHWYIGVDSEVNESKVANRIDQILKVLNDDYSSLRKYLLKEPVVTVLPPKTFYEFMDERKKTGAQNKFPRVLSDKLSVEWETFLENR